MYSTVMGLVTLIRAKVFYPYGKFGRMMCYKEYEGVNLERDSVKKKKRKKSKVMLA